MYCHMSDFNIGVIFVFTIIKIFNFVFNFWGDWRKSTFRSKMSVKLWTIHGTLLWFHPWIWTDSVKHMTAVDAGLRGDGCCILVILNLLLLPLWGCFLLKRSWLMCSGLQPGSVVQHRHGLLTVSESCRYQERAA